MKALPFIFIAGLAAAAPALAGLWTDDYEDAVAQAKAEGKFLFLDFTGSDWCGWCIKLDNEVFSKSEFKSFAKDNLIPVEVDFPHGKSLSSKTRDQNEKLKQKHGIRGYPTIILLDPDENVIGKTGYKAGGAEAYVEHLEEIIQPHRSKVKPQGPSAGDTAGPAGGFRTWTSASGNTVEARYVQRIGYSVTLQTQDGRTMKIGIDSLSEGDQEFLRSIRAL